MQDWIGSILVLAFCTCLLFGFTWGGVTKPWNDPAIIALLVMSVVALALFVGWMAYMKDDALLPLALFRNQTQVGSCLAAVRY